MKIYDISQEVFSSEVFAGDPAPKREILSAIGAGDVCNLTAFSMCAHNGTHIDAPYHFFEDGETVERLDVLSVFSYGFRPDGTLLPPVLSDERLLRAARERGAKPVLLTPIARRLFDEAGNFRPGSHGAYPDAMRALAIDEDVPLIDLTEMTERFLPQLGDEPSKPLFMWPKDNTHLKPEGAVKMAGFVAEGLQALGGEYAAILAGPDEGAGV
jgi:hypothetical protein